MTIGDYFKYLRLNFRGWRHLVAHPGFTVRLGLKRLGFTVARRFVGAAMRSPVTGELIFNVQSLHAYWSIHVVRELGDGWEGLLREWLNPVVYDVGANMGQFGLFVKSINPSARVLAFEPQAMRGFNGHAERYFSLALSDREGMIDLNLHSIGWSASTSEVYQGGRQRCEACTLREVMARHDLPKPTVLKIDVDGAEFMVLGGGAELLADIPIILIEISDERAWTCLPVETHEWRTVNGVDWCGVKLKIPSSKSQVPAAFGAREPA